MPVSQTTFDQRIQRINKGLSTDASGRFVRSKRRRSFKARCKTFPFLVGAGILTGMPAYAYVATEPEMYWVLAEVQRVISLVA
jgi:hypothetical protein